MSIEKVQLFRDTTINQVQSSGDPNTIKKEIKARLTLLTYNERLVFDFLLGVNHAISTIIVQRLLMKDFILNSKKITKFETKQGTYIKQNSKWYKAPKHANIWINNRVMKNIVVRALNEDFEAIYKQLRDLKIKPPSFDKAKKLLSSLVKEGILVARKPEESLKSSILYQINPYVRMYFDD